MPSDSRSRIEPWACSSVSNTATMVSTAMIKSLRCRVDFRCSGSKPCRLGYGLRWRPRDVDGLCADLQGLLVTVCRADAPQVDLLLHPQATLDDDDLLDDRNDGDVALLLDRRRAVHDPVHRNARDFDPFRGKRQVDDLLAFLGYRPHRNARDRHGPLRDLRLFDG